MKRTLVVTAHLDDEIFGLGGTLVRLTKDDPKDVCLLSLCHGRDDKNRELRLEAASQIANMLKYQMVVYPHYDMELEKLLMKDVTKIIEKTIADFKPDRIFTVSEADIHQDHQIVSKAVKIAARPSRTSVKEIYEFKTPGGQPYGEVYFDTINKLSDEEFKTKKELAEKYTSEKLPAFEDKEYFRTIYREFE